MGFGRDRTGGKVGKNNIYIYIYMGSISTINEFRLLRMRTLAFTEMDTIDNTVSMQRQVAMDKLILSMIQVDVMLMYTT
jgi:hypothetical protein